MNLLKIQSGVKLAPYTTFGIGGKADYFVVVKNEEEIKEALEWAKKNKQDFFILGGGSNILITDKGIRGLVIKMETQSLEVKDNFITAAAGVLLSKLVAFSLENQLSGLEFLAGIPGTVGGAIRGNAGGKKDFIGERIERVKILNSKGEIIYLSKKECCFDYRFSRFAQKDNKEIILEGTFVLKKENPHKIRKKIKENLGKRKKFPVGKSVGSIFKNHPLGAAGYFIENAGLKGKSIGGAVISKVHANWIINRGEAKASDVLQLINLIKTRVFKEFKVRLEEEIVIVGEK